MRHRLCVVAAAVALAACGSDSAPTGQALCDKAASTATGFNAKVAACVPGGVDTGIPTGTACTTKLSSCTSSDQATLNAILDCLNGLPTLSASQCTGSAALDFGTRADACTTSRLDAISTACQTALGISTSGFSPGGTSGNVGACTYAISTGGSACVEVPAVTSSSEMQAVCSLAAAQIPGITYSSAACATAGRVGRCTASFSGLTETISFYGMTQAAAQQQCTAASGSFTAG